MAFVGSKDEVKAMCKILISGYYGFGNAGDEALLSSILQALLELEPQAEITVISGNPQETMKTHKVKAIGRFAMWNIYQAVLDCDMLISGGGSLLQDVTSARSLYYYLSIIALANTLGKRVMIYAQGIGPLRKPLARTTVGHVLNRVSQITVRDHASKEELLSLGIHDVPITVTADAVLGMHPVDTTIGRRMLESYGVTMNRPIVGVSVRSWKDCIGYQRTLAEALDQIQTTKDAQILFIPMQHREDTAEAESIAKLMRTKSTVLADSYSTTELLALSGSVDVMIGVRLHALVFSALMETPCLGISYDPKILNFLHMIGEQPVGDLHTLQVKPIVDRTVEALKCKTFTEATLGKIHELRRNALENARIAIGMLHDK